MTYILQKKKKKRKKDKEKPFEKTYQTRKKFVNSRVARPHRLISASIVALYPFAVPSTPFRRSDAKIIRDYGRRGRRADKANIFRLPCLYILNPREIDFVTRSSYRLNGPRRRKNGLSRGAERRHGASRPSCLLLHFEERTLFLSLCLPPRIFTSELNRSFAPNFSSFRTMIRERDSILSPHLLFPFGNKNSPPKSTSLSLIDDRSNRLNRFKSNASQRSAV